MSRSEIMLAYPFEEKRLEKWGYPVLCQPKLDGERCRAVINERGVTLYSSECNIITSVPHINEALRESEFEHIELDGELYSPKLHLNDIQSIVSRTVNRHENYEEITFNVFDLVIPETIQAARIGWLNGFERYFETPIHIVPTAVANSVEEVMALYETYLSWEYEGIIVRHPGAVYVRKRATTMMKFKPKKSDIYKIVGYKEEVDKYKVPKNRLGSLVCQAQENENTFSTGSGLTEKQRIELWEDPNSLIGKYCHVKYQHLTPGKKVPRSSVFIKIIDKPYLEE